MGSEKVKMTRTAFARALGLSPGRVTQLVDAGLPTCDDGRLIPLEEARAWYRATVHAGARKRGPKGKPPEAPPAPMAGEAPAERLLRAQAERTEALAEIARLEARRRRGELLEAGQVEAAWTKHILAARERLLGLPGKLAPRVLGKTDVIEIQEAIRRAVYDCLTALAGGKDAAQ